MLVTAAGMQAATQDMSVHTTRVYERRQLSSDDIIACTRDGNYPNYSYSTELWVTWLSDLLTSVNQTPTFISIFWQIPLEARSCGELLPHTSSVHPKQHPHTFQQSPLAQLSMYLHSYAVSISQLHLHCHVDLVVSLDFHRGRSRARRWLHPLLQLCNSSLNSPFLHSCLLWFLPSPGSWHKILSCSFFFWIVYSLPHIPFFSCSLPSPKLPATPCET